MIKVTLIETKKLKEEEMSVNKEKVVEYLSQLPVIEMAQLVKELEEKWGVSASAPVSVVAQAGAAGAEADTEQTEFSVTLASAGSNKISVIKEIRTATNLGLREAKELVDGAPKLIKESLTKEDAQKLKESLEKAGAKVEVK